MISHTPGVSFLKANKPTRMHETNTARKLRHTSKRQPFRITYLFKLLKVSEGVCRGTWPQRKKAPFHTFSRGP